MRILILCLVVGLSLSILYVDVKAQSGGGSVLPTLSIGTYELGEIIEDPGILKMQFKGHNGKVCYLIDLLDPSVGEIFIPVSAKKKYVFKYNGFIYEITPQSESTIVVHRLN